MGQGRFSLIDAIPSGQFHPQEIGPPAPEQQMARSPAKQQVVDITDSILEFVNGLIGIGPETKSNLAGQLIAAAVPVLGGVKSVKAHR